MLTVFYLSAAITPFFIVISSFRNHSNMLIWIEISKEHNIYVKVFSVTFDQLNVSLQNKSINFP